MTKLAGVLLAIIALYLFVSYWPNTVSNGALTTVQTNITRAINQ